MRRPRAPGNRRFQLLWAAGVGAVALLLWVARSAQEPPPLDLGRTAAYADDVPSSCEQFARALPGRVARHERRRVVEGTPVGWAAYGDPAIQIRCGVPVFTQFAPGDELIVINGVAWDIDEQDGGRLLASLPRAIVNVEVAMPSGYRAELLSLLTDAVKQAQPL